MGTFVLIAAWEVIGRGRWAGAGWPALTAVVDYADQPQIRDLLLRSLSATAASALSGLVAGALAALVLAVLGVLLPLLQPGLDRLVTVINALPLIALGPLFVSTVGREGTATVVAALASCFAVFVAATAGLAAAPKVHRDLLTTLGAGRRRQLLHLRLPFAVPLSLDGLAQAAPAAVLGAVIGEWFGADRGLGVLLVGAMQNLQTELLWSAGLATTLLSFVAYAVVGACRTAVRGRFL
ncbi:ABC transporter permease [Streptomyces sp. NPDC007808]|uniref:ABC transporter permease n=1 Tax=Streptomyces sp. NPDC007808 TaxID=3364779 RepID=UPI0036C910C8